MIKMTVTEIGRITGMGHENTDSIKIFFQTLTTINKSIKHSDPYL
jgi:hypothetical protein